MINHRLLLTGIICFLCMQPNFALTAKTADTNFSVKGWQEVVISVSDLNQYITFFTHIAGWKVIDIGITDSQFIKHWSLPKSASARFAILHNPGTQTGFIRLMEFSGVKQQQIRSNTQSWDTGGIFDINVRVADMEKKFKQLQQAGWQAVRDPVRFTFGPFEVKEWIVRGPDGLTFALIERIKPELTGWPHLKEFSRTFNSTLVVKNMEVSRKFFMDTLGFKVYLKHRGASKSAGENVLGLPHNLATQISREVTILHPEGTNEGSVELLSFDGATGRDLSTLSIPPNLGILMLRFPAQNLDNLKAHLQKNKIDTSNIVNKTLLPPYGSVKLFSTRAPDGAWLEFYEKSH